MIAVLSIGGWTKEMEINSWTRRSGRIEVCLSPPMTHLISAKDVVPLKDDVNGCKVSLYYDHNDNRGRPVFMYV